MPGEGDIIYRVNDRDEIVFANEEWDRFARANAGEGITSSHVLQRPLWAFISDMTTRELYRQVLKRVREGRPVRFNFRCDSPARRRLLAMEVGGEGDTVQFRTRTVLEEDRVPTPLLEADTASPDELLQVCGWCKKVFAGGSWEEVELAVERLQLFERHPLPSITHGVCEQCYQAMLETLAKS